ncbi:hypothetical protein [Nakamurella deserti]|uniref:hypothetical protein n=1 Tax=Nakamurella deserti TaxID=2164074 RepID=UPI000DBEAACD|nr:hypothetical protein [Nakamurella deserti]
MTTAGTTPTGRARGRRPHWSDDLPPATVGTILRERLYGNIACLSTLLVLTQHVGGDATAGYALLDVAIATGGLFGASLFAEFVAHLGVHGERLHRTDWRILLGTSGQIVQAAMAPMVLLAVSAVGWWDFHTALWTSVWVLVAQMGVFSFLAVRRTGLSWWGRGLLIAAIVAFGLVVIGVKTLAH